MVDRWRDPEERVYELCKVGRVMARGTLSMFIQLDTRWSAVFASTTAGLDGEYELKLITGELAPVRVLDLRESTTNVPSVLHGERPYSNLRAHTYALRGEGQVFLF